MVECSKIPKVLGDMSDFLLLSGGMTDCIIT